MLMSVSELNGLGDLGKFSLKKTIKKLNPITVTKKAVALVTHPKALIAAVKANNPIVVAKASIALAKEYNPAAVAKNTIELGKAVAKQQLAVTKKTGGPARAYQADKAGASLPGGAEHPQGGGRCGRWLLHRRRGGRAFDEAVDGGPGKT